MFEFIATIIAVIGLVSWAIYANVNSTYYKEVVGRLEREVDGLKREFREGKAGEVLIRFKNGKTGTFGKVDKIEEEGSFTVLRSYNGKIVAKASTSEVALITSAKLLKGDD